MFFRRFSLKFGFLRMTKEPRVLGCRLGKERSSWRVPSWIRLLGAAPVRAGFP